MILKGFRDVLPSTAARRFEILQTVLTQGKLHQFHQIETPIVEYAETILGEGGETDKQVYRFKDNGDRDVALRFDLTMSFARFMATNHHDLGLPFRRIQYGQVFRGEKPQRGRYREFTQCDVDIVGGKAQLADFDILRFFGASFEKLNLGPIVIRVGHRKVLNALFGSFQMKEEEFSKALIQIDKLEKIGKEKVKASLVDQTSLESEQVDVVFSCLEDASHPHLMGLEQASKELGFIQQMMSALNAQEFLGVRFELDLSIARGLGYYSGMVFETLLENDPEIGSIASGGRYDGLLGRFLKDSHSAVGGSFGIDRIVAAKVNKPDDVETTPIKVKVVGLDESSLQMCSQAIRVLSQKEFSHDLLLKPMKLGKLIPKLIKQKYTHCIMVGEDEVRAGKWILKSFLEDRQSEYGSLGELVANIT